MDGDKYLEGRLSALSAKVRLCSDSIKQITFEIAESNNKKIDYFTISRILGNCHFLEDISSAMIGLSEYVKIHNTGQ